MKLNIKQQQESRFLETYEGFEIWRLGRDRLDEFTEFVYRIYHQTRAARYDWQPRQEFQEMKQDGKTYFDRAVVCAITDQKQQLLGTWGLIYKNPSEDELQLPIEKRFGIDLFSVPAMLDVAPADFFFNGWRTAVDKERLEQLGVDKSRSILLFDLLLRGLTFDFGQENHRFIGVAEMENLVLRYHKRTGVPWVKLGEPRTYWGNTKYPCGFSLKSYIDLLRSEYPDRYELVFDPAAVKCLDDEEISAAADIA